MSRSFARAEFATLSNVPTCFFGTRLGTPSSYVFGLSRLFHELRAE